MSSALIGLVGVLVGGVLSGGIQWFLGWRDRKHQARVAASILFADLAISYQALQPLLDGKPPNAVQLERYLDRWKDEQHALAGGVSPTDFQLITVAFRNLDEYIVRGVAVPDKLHALKLIETIERGMKLTWLASGMKNIGDGTDTAQGELTDGR